MPTLTAAQILKHPELTKVTWDLKPTKAGDVQVAEGRGGPFPISYEIHGRGDVKLVWIMGLGTFKTAWQRQTVDFGHAEPNASKYSSLIFENRGMGKSGKPSCRYSTTEMAKDTLELVDYLGWTRQRELHVIGVSMGGMIAQELAFMIPTRIASLVLVSTAPRLVNTVGFVENLRQRINLFVPKDINVQLTQTEERLFSKEFAEAPDTEGAWPTNGDRFAAQELAKRQDKDGFTKKGFVLQAIAAGWHHKSGEQLRELGDKVGRERICVMHGTIDRMITSNHAELLVKELGGSVTLQKFEGKGHVLIWEERERFREIIEGMVEKVRALQ